MPPTRRVLAVLAVSLGLLAGLSTYAQAAGAPSKTTRRANVAGTYNGTIDQHVPKAYTGHIHFVVSRGKITGLRFTAGALCGAIWVVDRDHGLPTFPVKVSSTGSFSYQGTVGGRQIKLSGTLKGSQAHGTFFQAFPWGHSTCTMGQSAAFTATR